MPDPGYRWSDGHPQRKAAWRRYLQSQGPVPCGCGCGEPVHDDTALNADGKPWHLGHGVALRDGGDGADSTPWLATCNLREAAAMTNGRPPADKVTRRSWG